MTCFPMRPEDVTLAERAVCAAEKARDASYATLQVSRGRGMFITHLHYDAASDRLTRCRSLLAVVRAGVERGAEWDTDDYGFLATMAGDV